jgi:hypothetical protein
VGGAYLAARAGVNAGERDAVNAIPPAATAEPFPDTTSAPSTTEAPTTTTTPLLVGEIDPTTGLSPGAVENPSVDTAPTPPVINADGTFGEHPDAIPNPSILRDPVGAQTFISTYDSYMTWIINNGGVEGSGAFELMEQIGITRDSTLGQNLIEGATEVDARRGTDPNYSLVFSGLLTSADTIDFSAVQLQYSSLETTYEYTSGGINVYTQGAVWTPVEQATSSGLEARVGSLDFTNEQTLADQ